MGGCCSTADDDSVPKYTDAKMTKIAGVISNYKFFYHHGENHYILKSEDIKKSNKFAYPVIIQRSREDFLFEAKSMSIQDNRFCILYNVVFKKCYSIRSKIIVGGDDRLSYACVVKDLQNGNFLIITKNVENMLCNYIGIQHFGKNICTQYIQATPKLVEKYFGQIQPVYFKSPESTTFANLRSKDGYIEVFQDDQL